MIISLWLFSCVSRIVPPPKRGADYLVTGRHPRRLGRSPDLVIAVIGNYGVCAFYEGRLNEPHFLLPRPVETLHAHQQCSPRENIPGGRGGIEAPSEPLT